MVNFFKQIVVDGYLFYSIEGKYPYATALDLVRLKKNCIIGWCNASVNDNEMTITWFETNKIYRKKGLGDKLLKHVIEYARNNGISRILLDDMSDKAFKRNNIYLKNGFVYLEDGHPEMVLELFLEKRVQK